MHGDHTENKAHMNATLSMRCAKEGRRTADVTTIHDYGKEKKAHEDVISPMKTSSDKVLKEERKPANVTTVNDHGKKKKAPKDIIS